MIVTTVPGAVTVVVVTMPGRVMVDRIVVTVVEITVCVTS